MDAINLAYYAVVCALLSAGAPYLERRLVRLLVGAIVGLAAASLLPQLKSLFAGQY
ncbi:hypothetical protein [Flavimaricola marinus]|uniref:Uncharacterized protein n=1 Tax=Flavimaricola marinus TaxID=1819565 RepID=A0A238LHJ6_9RHOB|nr:hypothetical protein [Flavimaricola marinus]SMY09013.1 hypothetical protein LOM8899_03173 [Flavimaricola marinus]